jgi:hypothetical protein
MKQIVSLINKLFNRRQPVYGERIFQQRGWISKQVDDALWKRYNNIY